MKRSNTTGFAPSRTSAGHRTAMGRLLLMTLLLFAFLGGAKAQDETIYTGFTATDGTGGTSGDGKEGYDLLVDGLFASGEKGIDWTKWGTGSKGTPSGETGSYYWVDFHSEAPISVGGYILTTGNDNSSYGGRNPKSWVLKAKLNENDDWTTIATVSNDQTMQDVNFESYEFNADQTGTYKYFRFMISEIKGTGGFMQLCELRLKALADPTNIENATISGLQSTYFYTGNAISINYTVTAADGTVLNSTDHYDAVITKDGSPVTEIRDKGIYTLTITGKGSYTGTKSTTFRVANFIEIGDGGTTNNTYLPGYSFYKYSYTQQIYTADEIGTAGTINSIAFKNTGAEKTRTYNIYMALTDKETFANGTDWVAMSEDDLVFSGELTFAVGEWTTITLDTPFAYDGSSNLIVSVADNSGNYSSSPHMACLVFDATSQAIRAYKDGSAYDVATPGVTGNVMNVKNQIQLDITPSGVTICSKPSVAVSNITESGAVLTLSKGSGTYNVEYKKATETEWTTVATNLTETTFTLTGLEALTAYDVQVQSVCDDNATSDWRITSFTTAAVATAVGDSWSDDFEGTECGWELINGELTNAWTWGEAVKSSGTHALYISNDGGTTNAYTNNSPTKVFAAKLLGFAEGKYEFSYDWMANGESTYDFLRVALVPATQTLTAGTDYSSISSSSLPSGWIALDGGSKLNLFTEWQTKSVAIDVAAGNYYLVVAWRNDNSQGNNPPAAIDNVSISRVTCSYVVEDFDVSNISTTGATLTWTAGEATQWQVAYSINTNFEGATEEIVSEATYNLAVLQPGTHYYAKVRAYCGGEDFGSWSAVLEFNTDCIALDLSTTDYSENFDGVTLTSYYSPSVQTLPVCWSSINTTTYNTYKVYPTIYYYSSTNYSNSSPNSLRFYSYYSSYSSYDPQPQYAILPPMENLAGKQITLQARGYNANSTFKVGLMTDPTDATTFVEIAEQALTTSYQEFMYPIPADATAHYIAIMIDAATSERSTNSVYIDDIVIEQAPSCVKPAGLAVTANSIAAHSATVTWTERGSATTWIVEYADNEEFENYLSETVEGEPTYTFQGLAPETTYYVRVKAHCGEGDESEYGNVVNFTTTIACPAPTGFAVDDLSGYTATLKWTGTSDSYIVSYRTPAYTDGLGETFTGTSIPTGWENKIGLLSDVMEGTALTTSSQWYFGNYNGVFDQHARINIYGSGGTERHGWLISPAFTVLEESTLHFDLALTAYSGTLGAPQDTGTDDKFVVLISTDDEATWTILRQWDNEEGSTYVYNNIANTAEGEQVSIDLSSYVGQSVRIAFYGESTVSNADNNLHIDNVHCGIDHEAGQWQTVTVDEAPAILTGLTPETVYEAKLQGNCGDVDGLSEETGLITFTTLNTCPVPTDLTVDNDNVTATTADLSWHGSIDVDSYTVRYRVPEHLEGGINEPFEATSIPSGWTMYTGLVDTVMVNSSALIPATYGWSFGTGNGVFDSHARVNIYGNYQRWLVTPTVTLDSSTFTFDMALTAYSGTDVPAPATNGTDDKFAVLISTDNMETWTVLRQWDNEEGSTYVYNNIANTAEGEQVSIDLSSYVGQRVCIAFYGESTESNADNNLHIDNVIIGNPTVIPDSEWLTEEATATNVTLTRLTPGTTYEAQVKSDCSDPEEWSDVVTFTTPEATIITNTFTLAAGWNWVSFNIDITLDDLKNALVGALGINGISIHSQTQNTNYNRSRWSRGLSSLDLAQMYMIEVPVDCEIVLEGFAIAPAEHPVTISYGDNWIAFPFNEAMSVAEAFNGFAVSGDVIASQTAFAVYTGYMWRGTLTALEPGQGYIYHSAATSNRTFLFPEPQGGSASVGDDSQSPTETNWPEFNYHAYKLNSPVVAAIQINDDFIVSDDNWADLEVAAFVGEECRGHAFMADYVSEFDDPLPIVELPVYYSNAGDEVTFKLYDHANNSEYDINNISCWGEELAVITGDSHTGFYTDFDNPVVLSTSISILELADNDSEKPDGEKNTDLINGDDGSPKNVVLADRTLYKDDEWNTICLPFDVVLEDSPLSGAIAKTLTDATMTGTHVTLTFGNAVDVLEAGVPYIIKWANNGDNDIVDPVFSAVTIVNKSEAERTIEKADGNVKFIGYYDAFDIDADDTDIYYMTAGNKLKYTGVPRTLKACRAYFQFTEAAAARQFVLDFGDGDVTTGIVTLDNLSVSQPDDYYDLLGRKMPNGQMRKGLYINNGKKVVIK